MSGITPSFDPDTNRVTLPRGQWATYWIGEEKIKGSVVISEETTVIAKPVPPAHFREGTETEWTFAPGATQLPAEPQVVEPEEVE